MGEVTLVKAWPGATEEREDKEMRSCYLNGFYVRSESVWQIVRSS